MSESAISPRALNGAEEFDRRMRSIAQSSAAHSQALEELARLVGQQDPFGEERAADAAHSVAETDRPITQPPADYLGYDAVDDGGLERSAEAGLPSEPAVVHPPVSQPEAREQAVVRYPSISVHDLRPVETSPDAWAEGADEERYVPPMPMGEMRADAPARPDAGHAKRTLMVLLAVIVLTGGGLAAALLKHPAASGSVVATATATPTIMAATGPTKVQPETPATNADTPSEPSTLLDKGKNDGTAAAKVVNSVEQPVDLGQAMKPAAASAEPTAPASPFPEPRKVKTILVRPDGSIIADAIASPAEAAPSAASQQANLAFDPTTAIPIAATRPADAAVDAAAVPPDAATTAAKPSAGKTTARVPAAKPAASTSQGGTAAAEGRSAVATPKAKPAAHIAKPKPKPAATVVADAAAPAADAGPPTLVPEAPATVADATPTAAAPAGQGGSFAVQLGAAPTESEGQATADRLAQRYAGDFGGSKPSVRKAAAAGKTVFRIRVGNLSQDEAKALCGKVQAGGGACFVARN